MNTKEKITEILKAYTKKHNISASVVILEEYAETLVKNGALMLDCNVITSENRPLITHIAEMPLNDVLDLIRAKDKYFIQKEYLVHCPGCGYKIFSIDNFCAHCGAKIIWIE